MQGGVLKVMVEAEFNYAILNRNYLFVTLFVISLF